MTEEYIFDINMSINSDEEIRQINVNPFQTNFNRGNTQINIQNEGVNQPAPSPEYKFMGIGYSSNDEQVKSQQIETNLDNSNQAISQFTINVSKSVDIYLDNKRNQNNDKVEVFSMQLIKMNMLKNKNVVYNHKIHQKKSRNYKNVTSNIRNLSPQGILKISSCELPLNKNTFNLQLISNKKVSFEFTKEQIKKMKRINFSNVLIKQRTRLVLN